jgi:hypothetical protein
VTHAHDQNTHAITSRRSQRMSHHRSATSAILLALLFVAPFFPHDALGASLMPQGKQAYFAANGAPLAGGKVYTYAAGTSTPLATYSDQAGATPNANPVVLNSRGEASIFWGTGPYKVTLRTSADALVWTQDNLYPPFTAAGAATLYNGGSAAAPELTWIDDLNSGFYVIGEDNIGLSLGGTKRWDFAAAGSTLTGTLGVSGATTLSSTLAVTGASTFTGAATFNGAATFTGGGAATFDSVTAGTLTVAHAATFTDPVTVGTATSSQHAATKAYVDAPTTTTTTLSAGANWTLGVNVVRRAGKAVFVEFTAAASNGSALWAGIGTVPAAYRPTDYWEGPCRAYDSNVTTYYPGWCAVAADGVLSLQYYDNGTSYVAPFAIGASDTIGAWISYVQ